MRTLVFFRHALWRDLKGNRRFAVLYCISLMTGLLAFGLLSSVQTSVSDALSQKSRNILTSDLVVSSRVEIESERLDKIEQNLGSFKRIDRKSFFSMVRFGHNELSRLVDVQAIPAEYPYYGDIVLQNQGIAPKGKDRDFIGKAWVAQELLTQTGAKIGDLILLGKKQFTIADVIVEDVSVFFGVVTMAPRIYIDFNEAEETGLVDFGSTITRSHFYILDGRSDQELKELAKTLQNDAADTAIRIRTHMDSGEGTTRLYERLSDYLNLVALTALFMAGLAVAFLIRSFIQEKISDVAVLNVLGLSFLQAISVYLVEILLLALFASILAWLLSTALLPVFYGLVKEFITLEFNAVSDLRSFLLCFVYAAGVSLLALMPTLFAAAKVKPGRLLLGEVENNQGLEISPWFYIPVVLVVWALAVLVSRSWLMGSAFAGGIFAAIAVFTIVAHAFMRGLRRLGFSSPIFSVAFATRTIVRYPATSYLAIISLGLSFVLLTLIPQMQNAIGEEFVLGGDNRPDFFTFDIQDEQLHELQQLVQKYGLNLSLQSPLINARLLKVNDETVSVNQQDETMESRENQDGRRARNRGYNLTFRDDLFSSEKIVKGIHFRDGKSEDGIPMISIERRFAERLRVGLGDRLTFDVSSVPVEGRIVSIRDVRWVSFQPNFFIVFQSGVFDDAPKTWIAAIVGIPDDVKDRLQSEIVQVFPNISIIDVTKVTGKMSELVDSMATVLKAMAVMAVLAGLMLLYVLINFHMQRREWEYTLLRVLGVRDQGIFATLSWEVMLLLSLGLLIGIGVSFAMANAISYFVFQRLTGFAPAIFAILIALIMPIFILLVYMLARRINKRKPKSILEAV